MVKAFWPFIRRVTPRADFREFIACGVLNWRAIYITALGSSSQYVDGQERRAVADGGGRGLHQGGAAAAGRDARRHLRVRRGCFDSLVHQRAGTRPGNNHPVRYLLLTKHEPHPRQIGRIAERINTMGTMRLYALKDWAAVRNADPYIRILGQELDQITKKWGRDRKLINELTSLRSCGVPRRRSSGCRTRSKRAKARTPAEEEAVAAEFTPRVEHLNWNGVDMLRLRKVLPTQVHAPQARQPPASVTSTACSRRASCAASTNSASSRRSPASTSIRRSSVAETPSNGSSVLPAITPPGRRRPQHRRRRP